jgi:hypothetical protein
MEETRIASKTALASDVADTTWKNFFFTNFKVFVTPFFAKQQSTVKMIYTIPN